MASLILVRHGQSIWNLQNRFTGWVDVDLSELGIREEQKSCELIKSLELDLNLYFASLIPTFESSTSTQPVNRF